MNESTLTMLSFILWSQKDQNTAFMAALGHPITGCSAGQPVIFDVVSSERANERTNE